MNLVPNVTKYDFPNEEVAVSKNKIDESVKKVYLRGNPFLYNHSHSDMKIESIEEYYVKYNGEEKTFGEVVRCFEISKRKKKKFLRKTLKTWEKEYLRKRNELLDKGLGTIKVIDEIDTMYFRPILQFALYLILILMILILKINASDNNFLGMIINNIFDKYSFIRIMTNVSIYLLLIAIIYSFLFKLISKDFKNNYNACKKFLFSENNKIRCGYKKRFRSVKKYYIDKINQGKTFYSHYDINLVGEGKSNLDIYDDVSVALLNKAKKFKDIKLLRIILKYVFSIMAIASSLVIIVYVVYEVLRSLLF